MPSYLTNPRVFLRLAQVTLGIIVLNVVTGAAVRLSDSGLGCPDWPTCSRHHLTAPLAGHRGIEFGNRLVVAALIVATAATVVAAVLRRPRRRDVMWLSCGLLAGVLAEAVIGGLVVLSKLNPYVVMGHFMVGMLLLADAVVLALRAGRPGTAPVARVSHRIVRGSRLMVGLLVVVLAAGTAATGAGPHAGGKGAKRLPLPLEDAVRIHSGIVLVLAALTLLLLLELWRQRAPDAVQRRGHLLLAAMAAQGIVGYTQYFTHLPALLVGVHVLGATTVWSTALWFHAGLFHHDAGSPAADRLASRQIGCRRPGEAAGAALLHPEGAAR